MSNRLHKTLRPASRAYHATLAGIMANQLAGLSCEGGNDAHVRVCSRASNDNACGKECSEERTISRSR